jgi:hypothetical protein
MVSMNPFECILSSMEIASIAIQATISTDILHKKKGMMVMVNQKLMEKC